jgi:hypothetical protein
MRHTLSERINVLHEAIAFRLAVEAFLVRQSETRRHARECTPFPEGKRRDEIRRSHDDALARALEAGERPADLQERRIAITDGLVRVMGIRDTIDGIKAQLQKHVH